MGDLKSKAEIVKMNTDRILNEKGLQYKDLADRMCVSKQTVCGYFKPKAGKDISDETVERIAEALEVKTKNLLYSEDKNKRMEYYKAKKEFYRTIHGRIVLLLILGLIIYLCLMYQKPVIMVSGVLATLFLFDFSGKIRPDNSADKESTQQKVSLYVFRATEVLILIVVLAFPIIDYIKR
jgi:DNA-binding Xre family transcriptional regulator